MNEPVEIHYEPKKEPKKCDAMVAASKSARAHQCTNDAKWHPVFELRCKQSQAVVRAGLEVHLCDSCRASCKLTDLMTAGGWQTIIQAFLAQKKLPPKRSLTTLAWVEIDSEEAHHLLHSFS
jgi:hypothetical protein